VRKPEAYIPEVILFRPFNYEFVRGHLDILTGDGRGLEPACRQAGMGEMACLFKLAQLLSM